MPLHIFEERYKLMIGECLDEAREFGIVWLADDALKESAAGADHPASSSASTTAA